MDCELPLLLSKDVMEKAETTINFVNDTVNILGETIDLEFTSSGHYMIPVSIQVFFRLNHLMIILNLKMILYFGVQICLHSHIQKRKGLLSSFRGSLVTLARHKKLLKLMEDA